MRCLELAVDDENGTKLIDVPVEYGGSNHTRYHVISETDFDAGLT